MAIRTTAMGQGGELWNHGWHEVTIKDAKYGVYNNEVRYIDMTFEEYPETLNLRIYEAKSKTGEEFAIAKLFRLANAGIIGEVVDTSGKKMLQFDDEATNLVTKKINIFLYKNEEGYFRVLNRIAPIVQEGEVLSYNENDLSYWKNTAEKYYEDYKKPSDSGVDVTMNMEDIVSALDSDDTVEENVEDTVEAPF